MTGKRTELRKRRERLVDRIAGTTSCSDNAAELGARWANRWRTMRANDAGLSVLEDRLHPALMRELRSLAVSAPETAHSAIEALLTAGRRELRSINEAAKKQLWHQ